MRRPHWRKMTWVLIIWCALILIWAIAGGSSAAHETATNCAHQTNAYFTHKDCVNASETGAGIGEAFVFLIGFVGFVFFAIIWFMSRPKRRDCPVCGNAVKRGVTACGSCGYDFAAAAKSPIATT